MSNKISALIFSINEYELVHSKIKLLYPYVDEIVIIDSSTDKKQKRLMKNLEKKYKKVRVIWLPPLGIVDFYYKIGIDECKYDWILHLEADDIPSKKLLEDLRKLVNDKYDAYKIYRDYDKMYVFRLYRKSIAYTSCLIHYLIIIEGRNFLELNFEEYFISSPITFKNYKRKLIKYSIIDSYQQLFKLVVAEHFADRYSPPKLFMETCILSKIFNRIKFSYFFSVLIWLKYSIASLVFNIFRCANIFSREKYNLYVSATYIILVIYFFLLSPYRKYLAIKLANGQNFCEFMGFSTKKEILSLNIKLDLGKNGLDNFLKIFNYKLMERYKNFYLRKNNEKKRVQQNFSINFFD